MSSQNPVFRIIVALRDFYIEFYGHDHVDLKAINAEAHKAHSMYHVERLYVDQNIDEKGYAQMKRRHLAFMKRMQVGVLNANYRMEKLKAIIILEALLGPDPDIIGNNLKVLEKEKDLIILQGESPTHIYKFSIVFIHHENEWDGRIVRKFSVGVDSKDKANQEKHNFKLIGYDVSWREAHNRVSDFIRDYNNKEN